MPTKKLRGQPPVRGSENVMGVYAGSGVHHDGQDAELQSTYKGSAIGGGVNQEDKVFGKGGKAPAKGKHVVKTYNVGY